ncbi:MAG: hypothetical protein WBJ37_13815 [Bacteroidales bacterium]
MRRKKSEYLYLLFIILPLIVSCSDKNRGKLIITREEISDNRFDYVTGKTWRYPEKSSLIEIDITAGKKNPIVLTGNFYSACSPDVSYDGKKILFAGKINRDDYWQIYEMKLSSRKFRKVIDLPDNCTDPLWLPGGRILFVKSSHNDTTGITHNLYTCLPDGSDLRQVTFHPHADFAPSLLADGRVIFITKRLYPSKSSHLCYVMRPDGTKADKYFSPEKGSVLLCRARENNDGNIYFIESSDINGEGGMLFSVHRNRPLHTRKSYPSFGGGFRAVYISQAGEVYVSWKKPGENKFGIYRYDTTGQNPPEPVYEENDFKLTDVIVAEIHPRQKKLPSEVDFGVKSGQIMCQDINVLGPELLKGKKAGRIELLGVGVSLGEVDVEKDGSFYLKPLANMPFRIQTIDEKGNVLNGPSGWIWMRPNERRGCVGCHEDPELVPENRVPLAVKKFPVIVPIHIEKIKEKSVELE